MADTDIPAQIKHEIRSQARPTLADTDEATALHPANSNTCDARSETGNHLNPHQGK